MAEERRVRTRPADEQDIPASAVFVLLRGGEVAGMLQIASESAEAARAALADAGLDAREAEMDDPQGGEAGLIALTEDCTEAAPRGCEVAAALGIGIALGRGAGVDTSALERLAGDAQVRESDVEAALADLVAELPPHLHLAGQELLGAAFG